MFHKTSARHSPTPAFRWLLGVAASSALVVATVPAMPVLAEQANVERIDHYVLEQMARTPRVRVMVVARHSLDMLKGDLHRAGAEHSVQVPIVHALAVELTRAQIDLLSENPDVERIIYDAPVRLNDTAFDPSALATVYPAAVDAVAQWSNVTAPGTGMGIGVAVVDSGIAAHPDFSPRVVINQDFNPNVTDANDAYGHGTAVSGIVAGNGSASAGQYIGIAPQANLINLRVNDGTGAAPTSAIMNAILWAVSNRAAYNIRVLNLSLSSSVQESYLTSPIDAAVEYAWLKGIVVVVAAGNNGPNSALYAPANDPYVITVGATDDRGTPTIGDDTLAAFSSFGTTQNGYSKPDFVAPGRHIITTLAPNSNFAVNYPSYLVGSQYIQLSGTSVAAPIISGVAALYIERNPTVRPGQLKGVLLATAQPLGQLGTGAGYPDATRAVSYTGLVGNADHGIVPNNYLQIMYMQANSLQTLLTVSWDSVSWDTVSWASVSWDSVSWDAVSWGS